MTVFDSRHILAVVAALVVIIDVGFATHFRGGTMSWSPYGDPANQQIQVYYRLAWKADTTEGDNDCTQELVDTNGRVDGDSGGLRYRAEGATKFLSGETRLGYICTERHEAADYPDSLDRSWIMGENTMIMGPAPGERLVYELVYQSCCWVRNLLNYEVSRDWDFVMKVDLTPRSDTGRINSSPLTTGFPVYRIPKGCTRAKIVIPTYDADGDDVTCRWVSRELHECRQNCADSWSRRIFILKKKCDLLVRAANAEVGWYAMAMVLEDSTNGVVHSKIPFQFLLEISPEMECNIPTIIGPNDGACYTLAIGEEFSFRITAETSGTDRTIRDITTTNIIGMDKSTIQQVPGNSQQYYVTMTWTPSENGMKLLCFQPEDSTGLQGNQKCIRLLVGGGSGPTADGSRSIPREGGTVLYAITAFELRFSSEIQRPNQPSHIDILNAASGSLVFSHPVGTTPDDGVLFAGDAILFDIPRGLLQAEAEYTLVIPAGLARGLEGCGPESEAGSWNFVAGPAKNATPPTFPTRFLGGIQCFASSMRIFIPKTMVPTEDPTQMYLNEPTCVGALHNATHFVIGTHYQYCGTKIRPVPDQQKTIMSNTIRIPVLGVNGYQYVTRRRMNVVNMVCEVNNDQITRFKFDSDISVLNEYEETGQATFNFSLRAFPSDSYTTGSQYTYPNYPIQIQGGQRMYFEAKAFITKSTKRIFLKSCAATPSPNPVDQLSYRFIEDGCARDDTVRITTVSRKVVRFSIDTFAFLGHYLSDSVYVFCDIHVKGATTMDVCSGEGSLLA